MMTISHFLRGSRFFGLTWMAIALGSCSIIQYNFQSNQFAMGTVFDAVNDCHVFQRSVHLGHYKPKLPSHEILPNLPPEMINDLLMTHAEALQRYIENEERYLGEDIERHRQRCQRSPD